MERSKGSLGQSCAFQKEGDYWINHLKNVYLGTDRSFFRTIKVLIHTHIKSNKWVSLIR
jgi:hypothetical protein